MTTQQQIVQDYVDGYNSFDVDKMLRDLDPMVVFENVSEGKVNLTLNGIGAFKQQATEALGYFSQREQKITAWSVDEDKVTIDIDYSAVAAQSFPNGLNQGDKLELKGKSEFTFRNGKIIRIRDIS